MRSDAAALRAQFPLLAREPDLRYLDNAATAQIHRSALDAVVLHETACRANVQRGTYRLAETADAAYARAREQAARFVNADSPEEIVFVSGTTAALNLLAHGVGAALAPGDAVLTSALEHHSNFVPWQQRCLHRGLELRVLPVTPDGRLDLAALPRFADERLRAIALTHCSNVTGAVTDVRRVVAAAKDVGARVLLDGAQSAQHGPLDVQALGIDAYAFSGHKCFGPNGVGVLWAKRELLEAMPPQLTGGGMVGRVSAGSATFADPPARFEAGTPPIAQAVGLGAALQWMMDEVPWADVRARTLRLAARLIAGLAGMPGARLVGPADLAQRQAIVSFHLDGLHPHDVCQVLDERRLCLRGGHHCAQPLMAAFGIDACTRASIALYNDEADIDALLEGLEDALRILR